MSHLLLFSLGPVQDFIATARRCQDLWFGSWLLSDLARAAATAIQAHTGPAEPLVVPGELSSDTGSVANEVIAIVTTDPARVAAAACDAVSARLADHMARFFKGIPTLAEGGHFHRDVAEAQVGDLIETIWAAVPYDNDYGRARTAAKALLASRKATRNWGPAINEGPVPKSSLDGARASVIDERAFDELRAGSLSPEAFRKTYKAKRAERLSGLDILKRVGQESDIEGRHDGKPIFHSTSHISSGPLRARLALHPNGGSAFAEWRETLHRDGVELERFTIHAGDQPDADGVPRVLPDGRGRKWLGLDGYLLYEDRIPELLSEFRPGSGDITKLEGQRRKELKQLLENVGLHRAPTAYYAVLVADGDKMGEYITNACTITRTHRQLSTKLEEWAEACRGTVEGYLGSCIYAGGDDVLALLPLHTALRCARDLANSFATMMKDLDKLVRPHDHRGPTPTLSVGLGLSHHMEPMRDALTLARGAEKLAKDHGRNALAIALDKRSGGRLQIVRSWDERLDERLEKWGELFGREALPDKVAFALEDAIETLRPTANDVPTRGVVRSLVIRALARRQAGRGAQEIHEDHRTSIEKLLALEGDDDVRDLNVIKRVRDLSAELQIARHFLDAYDEAKAL